MIKKTYKVVAKNNGKEDILSTWNTLPLAEECAHKIIELRQADPRQRYKDEKIIVKELTITEKEMEIG